MRLSHRPVDHRVLHGALSRLEPGAGKLARRVLRGPGDGDVTRLPDYAPSLRSPWRAADELVDVSRHDGQAVLGCRGGDEDIRVAEGVASFAPGLDHETPLKQDVLGDGQCSAVEQGSQPLVQPEVQLGPTFGIADQLDSESNLGEGHLADIQVAQRLRSDEPLNRGLGLLASKLRKDVGIEQPSSHRSTSRTGPEIGGCSNSISARGEPARSLTKGRGSEGSRVRSCNPAYWSRVVLYGRDGGSPYRASARGTNCSSLPSIWIRLCF